MISKYKRFLLVLSMILLVFIISACGEKNSDTDNNATKGDDHSQTENQDAENTNKNESNNENAEENNEPEEEIDYSSEDNPVVTITMDNDDEILIELYPEVAPNTVNNFISLINQNFYDGLIFHRVIPGFMIQGGDPDGNGMGGPGYGIKGEFGSNNFENNLKHDRGVLSMARSGHPDSAGSQFFIMVENSPHLDTDYAGFGKVIEGIEAVDTIVSTDTDGNDKPIKEQKIKTVTVDTKDKDYPEPETN